MAEKSARQILKDASANKYKRWIPAVESEIGDPKSAMYRLRAAEPITVNVNPKFSLSTSDRVFTIGSCFARNVERAMASAGMDVIAMGLNIDPKYLTTGQVGNVARSTTAVLNKYSTSAILNELVRAFDKAGSEDAAKIFIEVSEGKFIDPHLSLLTPMSAEELSRVRKEVDRIIGLSKSARAAFITLGLTETWKDLETGMYLNSAPPPNLLVRDKGRFVFENSTFTRSFDEMSQVVELLKNENPGIRIVVTVSPVPLGTTFTTADVIVANTYSKSTLRAVAQALYDKYDYVDYFPSYEMVMHSPRELAWGDDQLHVRAPMVEHVVGHFMKSYVAANIDAAA